MVVRTIPDRTLSSPVSLGETGSKWGKWIVYSVFLGLCTGVGIAIYWNIRTNWKKAEILRQEELQKTTKDTLIVWKILAENIHDQTTLGELKTLSPEQALQKVRQFSSWFDKNQNKINGIDSLNLTQQSLQSLPDELGRLANLQTLQLDDNQLTVLPSWMGSLRGLRSLSLDRNRIKMLPDSFRQLSQLEWFHMENNQLSILPDWMGELTQLKKLFLSGNQLTSLPMSLTNLPRLERMDVKNNKFVGQPPVLAQLKRIYLVV